MRSGTLRGRALTAGMIILAGLLFLPTVPAQETRTAEPDAPAAAAENQDPNNTESSNTEQALPLPTRQEAIAARFKRFERTLRQMAEYMQRTDPERAELLFRAISRSQEDRISFSIEQIAQLLEREQLGDAAVRQEILAAHLATLLDLLQSEDRLSAIEREKQRLQDLIANVDRLIGKERDVRVATERGGDPKSLKERQEKVAGDTDALINKVKEQDAERNADKKSSRDGKPQESDGKPSEGESSEGDPMDGKDPEDGEGKKPSDSSEKDGSDSQEDPSKPGDPKESKPGEPSEESPSESEKGEPQDSQESKSQSQSQKGKPSDGKPQKSQSEQQESPMGESPQGQSPQSEQSPQEQSPSPSGQSQPSEQQDQQDATPGREQLEQARDEMEQAIKELERQAKGDASKHQDEAIRKLREAKEQLEEILRQLREEERKLLLASLESRFQRMLHMQTTIFTETVRLGAVPEQERTSQHASRAIKLARDEEEIVLEADKALNVLKEEGSSVAFPEAVQQLRNDMLSVVRLLERSEVGELTQGTEEDIIEAIKEMIEALQREMEKADQDQQQQQQQQQNQEEDRALVDQLAELKMLRSLQQRINGRTRRLGLLIDGEAATDLEVVRQLEELAARQGRIQEATYDIVSGRTKTDDSNR